MPGCFPENLPHISPEDTWNSRCIPCHLTNTRDIALRMKRTPAIPPSECSLSICDTAACLACSVYQSVVIKDVAQRYGIRDLATLEKVSKYLFSTSGNLFSTNAIRTTLHDAGVDTSYVTLDNQIAALEKTFVIYGVEQERVRGKTLLRPRRKYYPVDNGFRNLANGFNGADRGAQLEGIVCMELKRRGYNVSIGETLKGREIDFVARRGESSKTYIQVTTSMLSDSTRKRELAPLTELDDAFARIVLTIDWLSQEVTPEGIRVMNVLEWLQNYSQEV